VEEVEEEGVNAKEEQQYCVVAGVAGGVTASEILEAIEIEVEKERSFESVPFHARTRHLSTGAGAGAGACWEEEKEREKWVERDPFHSRTHPIKESEGMWGGGVVKQCEGMWDGGVVMARDGVRAQTLTTLGGGEGGVRERGMMCEECCDDSFATFWCRYIHMYTHTRTYVNYVYIHVYTYIMRSVYNKERYEQNEEEILKFRRERYRIRICLYYITIYVIIGKQDYTLERILPCLR
jgi:hypothetical protein